MSLTGLYLMTGIRLLPGRLSLGPVLPFMAVALGQAAGSPLVGLLARELGYTDTFSLFAAIGIIAALLSPMYPRLIDYGPVEEAADMTGLQAAYDQQLQDEAGEPLQVVAVGGLEE
jgi:predicted MFS family arabinose efflux permease